MDTRATSHMTSTLGTLLPYYNSITYHNFIVRNDRSILIHGFGHTHLPSPFLWLSLNNVLHAPRFIKKFTSNYYLTLEIDAFGFFVNDLKTEVRLMRCEFRTLFIP